MSTFFSGTYDGILESMFNPESAHPAEFGVGSVSVNATLGSSTNLLQSPRNAINLSGKWLKWFDEGKIVLQESGGRVSPLSVRFQFFVCLNA